MVRATYHLGELDPDLSLCEGWLLRGRVVDTVEFCNLRIVVDVLQVRAGWGWGVLRTEVEEEDGGGGREWRGRKRMEVEEIGGGGEGRRGRRTVED